MNSTYCDHCGKQNIDHADIKEILNPLMTKIQIKEEGDLDYKRFNVDLCEDCYKKLLEFIHKGKNQVVEKFNEPIYKTINDK